MSKVVLFVIILLVAYLSWNDRNAPIDPTMKDSSYKIYALVGMVEGIAMYDSVTVHVKIKIK